MTEQTFFSELKQEHVEDATAVVARSFTQMNNVWKHFKPNYDEVYPIIRGKILPVVKNRWGFVLMKGKKVIGVSIQYDVYDFMKMPSMPSDYYMFQVLGETGRNLDKKVDWSRHKKGDALYGLYGVIDPAESGKKHALKFWWGQSAIGKACGWKYFYSRITSPVSLALLKKLGAKVVAEVDVVGATNEKMWMIELDLAHFNLSYTQMLKMMSQARPKI